jgi:exodeoxyribonuclease VII large subunit
MTPLSLFDPPPPAEAPVLTVSELTAQIRASLEEAFPAVRVSGEISNLARPASGHVYLTLKDSQAQIRGVVWRNTASKLKFNLTDGLEVVAHGRLSVYPPRGDYQLYVEELQPKGMGALELALRQLMDKLQKRGWFDAERKKPLPRYPRRIGIVTSPSGAAVRDMLRILPRRWPAADIVLCPVLVQGEGAAAEIAAAVRRLNFLRAVDVMIVGRGGGSLEDLWAFNEEVVAEAIVLSRIPVVSAVGHQTDFTVSDFVADVRAATPSEAAELVVPDRAEVSKQILGLGQRMAVVLAERVRQARQRLDDLARRRALRHPRERLQELAQTLDDKGERLRRAAAVFVERQQQRIAAAAGKLSSLSPLNVLGRGYSLTQLESTEVLVRSADQVAVGDRLRTRLARGRVVSRVEAVEGEEQS